MHARIKPESSSEIAGHVKLASRAQHALHLLGFYAHPGGQLRDSNTGIWYAPTNAESWAAGGSGDPKPRMDDPVTVFALVAIARGLSDDFAGRAAFLESCISTEFSLWMRGHKRLLRIARLTVELLELRLKESGKWKAPEHDDQPL